MKIAYPLLLLALALPATASAQTPPPDERAAAQAFADAAAQFADGMAAPLERFGEAVERPLRGCSVPKRHLRAAFILAVRQHGLTFASDTHEATRAFRSELANVATADPVLISGRAAWRRTGRELEALPEPRGACAVVRAWRRAGYPRSTVREALRVQRQEEGSDARGAKLSAAVKRMVRLGVPEEEAVLFAIPIVGGE